MKCLRIGIYTVFLCAASSFTGCSQTEVKEWKAAIKESKRQINEALLDEVKEETEKTKKAISD